MKQAVSEATTNLLKVLGLGAFILFCAAAILS